LKSFQTEKWLFVMPATSVVKSKKDKWRWLIYGAEVHASFLKKMR